MKRSPDTSTHEMHNGGGGGGLRLDDYSHPLDDFGLQTTDDFGGNGQATGFAAAQSEVSAGNTTKDDPCSELVRYEPRAAIKLAMKKKRASKVYSDWNLRHQEIVARPPIVFNGTFPIDAPISSRFMLMKSAKASRCPATIAEEASSSAESTTDGDEDEWGDCSDIDKRLSSEPRTTKCRALIRRPIDLTKSRLRRRRPIY